MNDYGADLDLRLVRYFTVLAEQLNFSRAATELRVAQPSLSRQIQRLEKRLGVRLLDRTPQGALLTEAGKAFLPQAEALLQAARQATLTARAYVPAGKIIIGYVEDLVITRAVRELRRLHPAAEIGTRHLECHEERAFTEGQVDVLVARAPLFVPTDGARVTVLYEEPRMLVVPADHPLSDRKSVSPNDFAGEEFICPHGGARSIYPTGAYQEHDPGPISAGPVSESFEDRLELIAGGHAIAVLPVGDRRASLRADLVTVPVVGFPASEVVVASRVGDPNPLVAEFLRTASAHLTAQAA
ncbi:LysR family transcriptional regulator [Mycolicibacterium conceptionense]|uniref:Probable hydrogen peroxide-inducible genes activator n=1 Tax=Mycolicibacterium conceptionense TaxID=451644 RepID=A0A1A0P7V4_9MYCO|nr:MULTISPECIES: LysR substrate-binding domain-containing protein [Mycolicibacterium]MCW1824840.1 LysR substrate-binding domain-containing protein [Mycolicibacterium senegalense]OBB06035.1 LysR family transcriptional regulator [Mycolicibacterium conceptionense]OBF06593.1 LysR family transcriptional regulator [Mycolicibacterium conceptionense]OBF19453.1 LysR family transcriptional regulator [Mycolicibacterium conceptionense]OBF38819.1 LysR family transcriptional regulator [Mycolicibacterium con